MPTTAPICDAKCLALSWATGWHALAARYGIPGAVPVAGYTPGFPRPVTPWETTLPQAILNGKAAAAAGKSDPATIAAAENVFSTYANHFIRLAFNAHYALQAPQAIAGSFPWPTGLGRSNAPSMRNRIRACLEDTSGLYVSMIHKHQNLQQAGDWLASVIKIPISTVGEALNTRLGLETAKLYAWEDGHVVTVKSPEAEWYWWNDRNVWVKNSTGQLAGGESGCSESFANRIDSCSWFGWDMCQIGGSIEEKIGGYTKGGGNWVTGIMSAWSQSQSACINRLKIEIIWKRNVWCWENGIEPPTYPEIGALLIPAVKPDLVAQQYAKLYGGTAAPSTSAGGLGTILAGAAAGFAVGGPPGAGVGAVLALLLGQNQQK